MKKQRRSLIAAAAVFAAASAFIGSPAWAQQVIKLTAVAGHPPAFLWVKTFDEVFIADVDKRLAATGKYKIDWTKAWGGTLVKLGSESKGVADGIADIGIVSTIFEAPKFPLQNISYFTPFGSDDIKLVSSSINDLQEHIPAMADAWTKNGLVYLGGMALDSYHMVSKFPIKSVDDLRGKKISAGGPSANWIKGTGAVPVASNLNTAYEDIKSGVSDGYAMFLTGMYSAKLYEVAPYITKVNFGSQFAGGIAFNKSRFDKLPPEVQKAMREAGTEWATQYAVQQTAAVGVALKKMIEGGAKVSDFPEAERKRWADTLGPVAKTWSKEVEAKGLPAEKVLDGYVADLKKGGAELPRDWSK